MGKHKKSVMILAVVVGVLYFVFIGLAISYYYTSNHIAESTNSEFQQMNSQNSSNSSDWNIQASDYEETNRHDERIDEKSYNIGLTEMAFRQRFNDVASKELSEFNFRLSKGYVYNGTYANVYQVPFDNTTSLTVSYEPDTELVRGIFLSGHPINDEEYVLFMGAIAGVVAALTPEITPSGRKALLQELGMFDGKHTIQNVANLSTARGNILYSLQGVEDVGVAFIAVANGISIDAGKTVSRDNPHNIMADLTNYLMWVYQKPTKLEATAGQQSDVPSVNYTSSRELQDTDASVALRRFHANITSRNYLDAYDCLTTNLQEKISFNEWVYGFQTTVRSTVKDIKVFSSSSERIVLTYNLEAEDNPGGVQNFSGTAVLVKTMAGWKINEIINKKK